MDLDDLAQVIFDALANQGATLEPFAADLSAVEVEGIADLLRVADAVVQALAKADEAARKE